MLRREGADAVRLGRPWGQPLEDWVLLVAVYWRTNLTLRRLAPYFGVSKSVADRNINNGWSWVCRSIRSVAVWRRDQVDLSAAVAPMRDHHSHNGFGALMMGNLPGRSAQAERRCSSGWTRSHARACAVP